MKETLLRGLTCPCVSEDDLKAGLPAGTSCQEFWPKKNFLSKVSSRKSSRLGSWTRLVLSWGGRFEGRLSPIKEFTVEQQDREPPYRAELASIEKKKVKGINCQPLLWQDVLVSLPHLVEQLFPGYSDRQIGNCLARLSVQLYRANSRLEWRPLIGPDLSKYCALIGGDHGVATPALLCHKEPA